MARYEISNEVRPLDRLITGFASSCGYEIQTVFNDLLRFIIHGFSPGAPPISNWKYKRQQNASFMEMTAEWTRIMQKQIGRSGWFDAFGELHMAYCSKPGQQANGQFFTPSHICELMVMCAAGKKETGQRMGDPTCGSGRLLLAYHAHNPGNYLVGEDISRTCCMMTVCNMLVHGCVGEVICHDSLQPKAFTDGWKVNQALPLTGIPSIRRMKEEEYRNPLPENIGRFKEAVRIINLLDKCKYSINSLVYWVTYVHNVVYSFYRSMIYCYINSTQRCAGSIVIDIIPTNGADKRKFFPFAPYFPVTNVIKRYFYPYFPAIIGIKGYSFPYFPYLSGIMKIKTALYSLFSRLDWHKTVVFPCLGEIYEGIRSLSWEIPVT